MHQLVQLLRLAWGEELRLVYEDAPHVGEMWSHEVAHPVARSYEDVDPARDTEPAHDAGVPLGVGRGLHEQHAHPAFLVIMGHLQEVGRLPAVHSSVDVVQLCHMRRASIRVGGSPCKRVGPRVPGFGASSLARRGWVTGLGSRMGPQTPPRPNSMGKVAPLSRCRHAGIGADRGELMSGAFDMLASALEERPLGASPLGI